LLSQLSPFSFLYVFPLVLPFSPRPLSSSSSSSCLLCLWALSIIFASCYNYLCPLHCKLHPFYIVSTASPHPV
ncbi:uncharacterized protein BO97DRAFT_373436, partial [Aspergillus homomorphus CBS 101889]